jgi:hypothetical protein
LNQVSIFNLVFKANTYCWFGTLHANHSDGLRFITPIT